MKIDCYMCGSIIIIGEDKDGNLPKKIKCTEGFCGAIINIKREAK